MQHFLLGTGANSKLPRNFKSLADPLHKYSRQGCGNYRRTVPNHTYELQIHNRATSSI